MKTIWKYPLRLIDGGQRIEMPFGAKIIDVHIQRKRPEWKPMGVEVWEYQPCLWAEVEASNTPNETLEGKPIPRIFHVFGTGHYITGYHSFTYLGTAHDPRGLVWHVYEEES